ncbi:hypothetical protein EMCRGX_G003106 [Ephydatia muelleri]
MSHACPDDPAPDGVDYPLVLSIPTGCERSQCSFYVAIRVSDEDQEFLDFKMQGRASGYIAIGFGKQKSRMNDADVFACAVNPNTSMVEAFDTYNDLSWTNKRDNDTSQVTSRNVCPRSGSLSFVNGTISCADRKVERKFLDASGVPTLKWKRGEWNSGSIICRPPLLELPAFGTLNTPAHLVCLMKKCMPAEYSGT